jgi:S1-C subfamily serine protease
MMLRRGFLIRFLLACTLMPSVASPALAERAQNPAAATVFIRVIGSVTIETDSTWDKSREERDVELGTGSGFLFTPYGHVLTNHHVIEGGTVTKRVGMRDVTLELRVDRVEVELPPAAVAAGGPTRYEATVDAFDPELDLAVLSIQGGELPYLAFGDSDAANPGDTVTVYGFPFGRDVEVGRTTLPDITPQVSVHRGSFSAVRADDTGKTSYLQTSATVNPGNSGGPMLDDEGYVLGVIRLKLRDADGIGFAIPVNKVKDFLESNGYSGLLGVERLRLGSEQVLEDKGLSLRTPDGFEDRSATRLRFVTDPEANPIVLVADRLATPWDSKQLESLLLAGGTFGTFRAERHSVSSAFGGARAMLGSASGRDRSRPAKLEYALLDAGEEKVLARFVGPADAVAFNRSVLIESLSTLQAQRLLTSEIASVVSAEHLEWNRITPSSPRAPAVSFPAPWIVETSAPFPCRGLAPMDAALAASPERDFTVSLRTAWWAAARSANEAARACGRPGRFGESSYSNVVEWLGVSYAVSGVFTDAAGGLLQLELVSPREKAPFVAGVFESFLSRNGAR